MVPTRMFVIVLTPGIQSRMKLYWIIILIKEPGIIPVNLFFYRLLTAKYWLLKTLSGVSAMLDNNVIGIIKTELFL